MFQPTLNSELLKAFLAVVEHRSFTRAATSLHRTQSAVSMQIKRLEGALGVGLFVRGHQSLELTAAGTKLVDYARRMQELNDQAIAQVRQCQPDERVRVGVMEDFGHRVMPPALARFSIDSPGVHVELHTGLTSLMLDKLGRDFDLVIAMHSQGQGGGALIRREQPVWAMGSTYTVEPRGPIPLALCPPECLLRAWAIQALDAASKPWHLKYVGQSAAAVNAMTARGETMTVVKSSLFPRNLRRVPMHCGMPDLPPADVRLHRANALSDAACRLADHLTAAFASTAR